MKQRQLWNSILFHNLSYKKYVYLFVESESSFCSVSFCGCRTGEVFHYGHGGVLCRCKNTLIKESPHCVCISVAPATVEITKHVWRWWYVNLVWVSTRWKQWKQRRYRSEAFLPSISNTKHQGTRVGHEGPWRFHNHGEGPPLWPTSESSKRLYEC